MNKLKLALDALRVESFETLHPDGAAARGTVLAKSGPAQSHQCTSEPGAPLCQSCVNGGCPPTGPVELCPVDSVQICEPPVGGP